MFWIVVAAIVVAAIVVVLLGPAWLYDRRRRGVRIDRRRGDVENPVGRAQGQVHTSRHNLDNLNGL
jgi:hypothetical protein